MRKTIIIVAITIFLSLAGTASAAPKAEKVDKNSWFKSGGFDIVKETSYEKCLSIADYIMHVISTVSRC